MAQIKIEYTTEMWDAFLIGQVVALPFHSECTYEDMCDWAKENGHEIVEVDASNLDD